MSTTDILATPLSPALPATSRSASVPRLLVLALILISSGLQAAIAPLLPGYVHRFALSGFQTGALVGVAGLAVVIIGLPAGNLADRFGARRLTLAAGWFLAAGALAQALSTSFGELLASRLIFGFGYGIMWTAGLTWLASTARRGSGMGAAVACSGAGAVMGPAFAGFLAGPFGAGAPFMVSGLLLVALTLGLNVARHEHLEPARQSGPVRTQLRIALGDTRTIAALAAVIVAGTAATVATLLVPLEMHSAGRSASQIGLTFSLAGAAFVLVSIGATLLQSRVVRVDMALVAILALAITLAPAALSTTTLAVVVMLCASTATRGVLWTSAYPLGSAGAERAGVGVGVVTGLLNVVWAGTTLLAPLLAGALLSHTGPRATFAALELVSLGVLALSIVWIAFRRAHLLGHTSLA